MQGRRGATARSGRGAAHRGARCDTRKCAHETSLLDQWNPVIRSLIGGSLNEAALETTARDGRRAQGG
jgi:hypothetical protein